MLTIVFGGYGVGKTAFITQRLIEAYEESGEEMLNYARSEIERANGERLKTLTIPSQPPIYCDYNVKIEVQRGEYFEPYYLNGYYFGLPNDKMPTQFVPPGSKIFFDEAQRYYNSRKSMTMPDHVSRAYEMHRHYGLDITMAVQRVMLIDKNIKDLCKHFIEIQSLEHEYNAFGDISKSVWKCREFDNWLAVEEYLNTGAGNYVETEYTYEGNIFDCYNSFNYFNDFMPRETKNEDFSYLKFKNDGDGSAFYNRGEPNGYRK